MNLLIFSVLKQLVLYSMAVAEGKLVMRFLKIIDIDNRRASTTLDAINTYMYLESAIDCPPLVVMGGKCNDRAFLGCGHFVA